jgi:REP element-mobilizing transposase RayT
MARPLRITYPGAVYHITNRGVNKQPIFFEEEDYDKFLEYLAEVSERMQVIIHGYCLMSNHYHLEITTPNENISRTIQWLNQNYAGYVNNRYDRTGHLFQGRFKSVLIEAESHLAALTRYIHLNPVRAGLVSAPFEYPWSSYQCYLGLTDYEWLNTSVTLERFGKDLEEQRKNYQEFVEQEIAENPLRDMVYGAILGSKAFVEKIQNKLQKKPEDREISRFKSAQRILSMDRIVEVISKNMQITQKELKRRGSKRNVLREIAIYLCYMNCNTTNKEIGTYFGGIDSTSVSEVIRRLKVKMSKSKELRDITKTIKKKLVE